MLKKKTVRTLYVLSSRGDRRCTWTLEDAEIGDREALAAIAEAEAIFARERARGSSAFKLTPGQPAERIDTFDRTAPEIVIIPRMAGG